LIVIVVVVVHAVAVVVVVLAVAVAVAVLSSPYFFFEKNVGSLFLLGQWEM
jgi:hypothetical protein